MLENLPEAIVYQIASFTEAPELLVLHRTHRNLAEFRLVRLGFGYFLMNCIGLDKPSEINLISDLIAKDQVYHQMVRSGELQPSVGSYHRSTTDQFSGFLADISNILMGDGDGFSRGAFRNVTTKIIRPLPHNKTFGQLRSPQYWRDIENNWTVCKSMYTHCVFRINRIQYRVIRKNYPTALALIY